MKRSAHSPTLQIQGYVDDEAGNTEWGWSKTSAAKIVVSELTQC
jgi:hypothetical protein